VRILRGTPVADLPFQQPARITFTLNLAAARRASIAVPATLIALADEVIE
jgi:putative ABC transport system substrate-binding protein